MTDIEDHATAVVRLAQNISNAPARYRSHLFAQLQIVVDELLQSQKSSVEAGINDDLERKLRVFLRALSTYPPEQQEWLKVFKTFSELLIKELRMECTVAVDPEKQLMERLRQNHRFRFVENTQD